MYLFMLSAVLWLGLTLSFHFQELITGIFVSFVLSLFLFKKYLELDLPALSFKKIVFFLLYVLLLFKEIIKANFDVAYRIIHPKMPIKPGIVVIKTGLKSNIAKTILANSITLTPGTFTLDILDDNILIHWINVKTENTDEATKIIGEKFEKYLKKIFT
ncbi:MAG: Na+/H+ antiporter subunit E [Bacteroidales bacterium]|nr:Na+/H+ antiporter subunit E [Bacteroidales bacterium]